MKITISITDSNDNTATWEGDSEDHFDCWESVGTNDTLDAKSDEMLEAIQSMLHERTSK